jgi:hypothetical protein
MRAFVTMTFALALAIAPAAAFAQPPGQPPAQPPAGQPPAGQPPAGQPPAAPAAPKIAFTSPAGLLLVQVKPDQTAVFEEMMGKIISGIGNSSDPAIKAEAGGWKYYKAAEPAGSNVMYIVLIDPAQQNTEYQFLEVLNKTMTGDQQRDPATQAMYLKYAAAIASMNKLNLTPAGK